MGDNGMNRVWSQLAPRHVIWFLLCALFGALLWIGSAYANRVIELETKVNRQNELLIEIRQDIKWIREKIR